MDQETAKKLFVNGGTFVFLDVPIGTEFGIDLNSWNTGKKFKGVKMIPPGVHFIYYSAVNKEGNTAPRTGFFHNFKKGELLVKKWDQRMEDISNEAVCDADVAGIKCDLRNLDEFLGAYPYETWRKWIALAGKITDDIVSILQPESKRILSAPELELDTSEEQQPETSAGTSSATRPRKRSKLSEEEQRLPRMKPIAGTQMLFSAFPEYPYPEGATPQEISKHSMDSSYVLECLIKRYDDPIHLLGELQMAFVCFLVAQNFDAFEHWKQLIEVICKSDDAIIKHPKLFIDFISDLYHQVANIPEDCFVDIVTSCNLIYNSLHFMFRNIRDSSAADQKLKSKSVKFEEHIKKKYKWTFDEETEDEAPVIVEDV